LYADLILLDISMPNLRGLEAIPEIKATHAAKIIVLTMHTEKEYLYQAFSAGADGYLLKDDPETELFAAIKKVRDGQTYVSPRLTGEFLNNWAQLRKGNGDVLKNHDQLSNREKQILKMIAEGKRSKEIADLLFISPRTVEHHRKNLMTKLSLKNTAALTKYALNHGYV
jgi:DNA-binding NarL/FixJ family response regulator